MSSTNVTQVSCLTCNAKVGISSTKNIYKTAFVETGEMLAPFISTTLSLSTENLRSPHLCLHCLNLFGKLEQAQRKVKSIRSEIVKKFMNGSKPKYVIVRNVVQDTPANSEVSSTKKRVVITPCMQKKIVNISPKKPNTNNPLILSDLDTKKTCVIRIKNNSKSVKSTELQLPEQSSDDIDSLSQSNEKKSNEKNQMKIKETVNLEVTRLPPSLQDHQYTQLLSTESHIDTSPTIIPVQQKTIEKFENKIPEEGTKLSESEIPTSPNCGVEEGTLKDRKLNTKVYICEKCGKVYRSQKTLNHHLHIHDGTSPFSCMVCKKCFTTNSTLKKHMLMHSEARDFECNICSKKFVHRTSLMKHNFIHSYPKIYKCDQCGLTFSRRSHLNRHLRIHTGDKRFSCGICGKRFFERYNVLTHLKVHDPERKRLNEIKLRQKRVIERRCERCNIDFASAAEYVVHLHTHTPENMIVHKENNFINYTSFLG